MSDLRSLGSADAQPESGGAPIDPPLHPLRKHLAAILTSRRFERADQLRRLLSYLIEAECEANHQAQTEQAIGVNVFRRRDFDPKTDTIVRTQVSRLRRKLDQYYVEDAPDSEQVITLDKQGYRIRLQRRPVTEPSVQTSAAEGVLGSPASSAARHDAIPAWRTFLAGVLATTLLFVLAGGGLALFGWPARLGLGSSSGALASNSSASQPAATIAKHPLWAPLFAGNAGPKLAISTPLFFRSGSAEIRDYRLNRVEDLPVASKLIERPGLAPSWDRWVSAGEMEAVAALASVFAPERRDFDLVTGRQIVAPDVEHMRLVAVGHPRGMPALLALLAEERFAADEPRVGTTWSGIVDRKPAPGQPDFFAPDRSSALPSMDDLMPDYALVSARHIGKDGYLLSFFGSRTQSSGFMGKALADSLWLRENIPAESLASGFKSAQFLFRVNYKSGRPVNSNRVAEHIVR